MELVLPPILLYGPFFFFGLLAVVAVGAFYLLMRRMREHAARAVRARIATLEAKVVEPEHFVDGAVVAMGGVLVADEQVPLPWDAGEASLVSVYWRDHDGLQCRCRVGAGVGVVCGHRRVTLGGVPHVIAGSQETCRVPLVGAKPENERFEATAHIRALDEGDRVLAYGRLKRLPSDHETTTGYRHPDACWELRPLGKGTPVVVASAKKTVLRWSPWSLPRKAAPRALFVAAAALAVAFGVGQLALMHAGAHEPDAACWDRRGSLCWVSAHVAAASPFHHKGARQVIHDVLFVHPQLSPDVVAVRQAFAGDVSSCVADGHWWLGAGYSLRAVRIWEGCHNKEADLLAAAVHLPHDPIAGPARIHEDAAGLRFHSSCAHVHTPEGLRYIPESCAGSAHSRCLGSAER